MELPIARPLWWTEASFQSPHPTPCLQDHTEIGWGPVSHQEMGEATKKTRKQTNKPKTPEKQEACQEANSGTSRNHMVVIWCPLLLIDLVCRKSLSISGWGWGGGGTSIQGPGISLMPVFSTRLQSDQ